MSIVICFAGFIFLIIGVNLERNNRLMRRDGVRVTAVIEELVFKPGERLPSGVVVRYVPKNNPERSASIVLDDADAHVEKGDLLEIAYNPKNLNEVCTAASLSGHPTFFGDRMFLALGILCIVGGALLAVLL